MTGNRWMEMEMEMDALRDLNPDKTGPRAQAIAEGAKRGEARDVRHATSWTFTWQEFLGDPAAALAAVSRPVAAIRPPAATQAVERTEEDREDVSYEVRHNLPVLLY